MGDELRYLVHRAEGNVGRFQPAHKGVIITYLTDADETAAFCAELGVGAIQMHGDITPAQLRRLRRIAPDLYVLKSLVGVPQIVFGSDFPYSTLANHVDGLQKCGFSAQELRAIDRENALRILPKYKG